MQMLHTLIEIFIFKHFLITFLDIKKKKKNTLKIGIERFLNMIKYIYFSPQDIILLNRETLEAFPPKPEKAKRPIISTMIQLNARH